MTLEEAYRLAVEVRDYFALIRIHAIGTFTPIGVESDRWGISVVVRTTGQPVVIWERADLAPYTGSLVRACGTCFKSRPLYVATCECGSSAWRVVSDSYKPALDAKGLKDETYPSERETERVPAGMLF